MQTLGFEFPMSCSSSSSTKAFPFFLPPCHSKFHNDLSPVFLHLALDKPFNLLPPIFIFSDDRKVICLAYTPCRYHCTSIVPICLKIPILLRLCKLSDALGVPHMVPKFSKFDNVRIGQKLMRIQYAASGNSKLNIGNIDFTRRL